MPKKKSHKNKIKPSLSEYLSYWPMLFIPATILSVYFLHAIGMEKLCDKGVSEIISLPMAGFSVLCFFLLALKTRNELVIAMTFLTAAFFCREWHFAGTTKGIYAAIALLGCWFAYRKKHIDRMISGKKIKVWLITTAGCFILSQLIARRLFAERHLNLLPMEKTYHIFLEETLEVTGHFLMIITSLVAWRTFYLKKNKTFDRSTIEGIAVHNKSAKRKLPAQRQLHKTEQANASDRKPISRPQTTENRQQRQERRVRT